MTSILETFIIRIKQLCIHKTLKQIIMKQKEYIVIDDNARENTMNKLQCIEIATISK